MGEGEKTLVVKAGGAPTWLVIALSIALGGSIAGGVAALVVASRPTGSVEVRPTSDVVVAIREIAKLETTEVHVEKVVDLSDRQSTFFGLIETQDALLLVAAGTATIGIDLEDLGPEDVRFDEASKTARLRLPAPRVLSSRLDEDATYVYTRSTDLLAKRNEHLEARARKEAVAAVERAAGTPATLDRAKAQAERQLRALLGPLGAKRVEIDWK